jgi:hypothetical protein
LLLLGSTHVPAHLTRPGWQVTWQAPALHTVPAPQAVPADPLPPVPHAPDAPQFALSVNGSAQKPAQLTKRAGHMTEQLPFEHACPAGQT